MSDSEHSTVTYTSVSEDDSDIGSPGVDGPPIMPEDPYAYIMAAYEVPPSPDYIPGPEVPPSPDYIPGPEVPPSPDYIPGPEEPQSPPPLDFVPESDPEEEPEEDDEDPEEDPADYPADRDDDDEEEEEEEHPAPADFVPPVHRMTARISIRDEPSISLPPREEVERLLALTTPPPSPLTPLSSPLPHIPSPPFPASVLPASPPTSPILPTNRPEITLPPQKRLGIDLGPRYEIGESSVAAATRPIGGRKADYGFVGTMDTKIRRQRAEEVGYGIRDVWFRSRTRRISKMAREAWGLSMDASDYARSDVMSLRTTVVAQSALILELQSADHRRQRVISELLTSDHKRQVQLTKTLRLLKGLQTQMVEFQRQHGPAEGPSQPDAPGEGGEVLELLPVLVFCSGNIYLVRILRLQGISRLKMAPKRKTTRLNPDATPTPVTDTHTTTSVTNAQIQAMINEGVTAALAARDATRNGDDAYFRKGLPERPMKVARECTYPDFQMPTLELQGH
ncbi:hypothetical protein Tco_0522926 [Tanacetum coccineum]